jgi:hypothetical protein
MSIRAELLTFTGARLRLRVVRFPLPAAPNPLSFAIAQTGITH